ncbi:DUF7847 domain-containing protein [Streptomyces termitum]|uniref:DUF7847 domain-containing protein n=1 Tax=Streptomyces termitum TaxID=67368 RepID=UPI0037B9ECE5
MTYAPGPYGYGHVPVPPPPKPGVIPLAPLDLGDVLSGAFGTYRRYWKVLLGVTAAAYGVAAVLVLTTGMLGWAAVTDALDRLADAPDPQAPGPAEMMPLFAALGVIWLAVVVGVLIATGLLHAAVAAVVQEAVLGRPARFGAVWRRAWSRLGSVLGALLLPTLVFLLPAVGFLIGFCCVVVGILVDIGSDERGLADGSAGLFLTGLLLFVLSLLTLPLALWVWIKYSLAPTAAVVESAGPLTALRRSSALVRGSWWRIFGCTLVMMLIVSGVGFVVQTALSLVGQVSVIDMDLSPDRGPTSVFAALTPLMGLITLVQFLAQAALAPLQPLASGLLYVDQRLRRENLGPVLAEAAAGPAA